MFTPLLECLPIVYRWKRINKIGFDNANKIYAFVISERKNAVFRILPLSIQKQGCEFYLVLCVKCIMYSTTLELMPTV